jgi:hypothetical protein
MPREIVFFAGHFSILRKGTGIENSGYQHKRKLLQEQACMTPTWPPRNFPDRQSL